MRTSMLPTVRPVAPVAPSGYYAARALCTALVSGPTPEAAVIVSDRVYLRRVFAVAVVLVVLVEVIVSIV